MAEAVNHPAHYNVGKIEVIEAIEDWNLNFSLGNAIKYIARADHKDKPLEDLKKARWYIDREIERREKCQGDPNVTRFKFHGDECRLTRQDDKFVLNECGYVACDVCAFENQTPDQYPCKVCCHGYGDREYFELDLKKVEVLK